MSEKKKRDKVVAEITLVHLTQLPRELGRNLTDEEAIAFFNPGQARLCQVEVDEARRARNTSRLRSTSCGTVPISVSRAGSPPGRVAM